MSELFSLVWVAAVGPRLLIRRETATYVAANLYI